MKLAGKHVLKQITAGDRNDLGNGTVDDLRGGMFHVKRWRPADSGDFAQEVILD